MNNHITADEHWIIQEAVIGPGDATRREPRGEGGRKRDPRGAEGPPSLWGSFLFSIPQHCFPVGRRG